MRSVGNRIAYMISDVNMNNGHPGLTKIAKTTLRLDVEQLKVGELVIFINRAFTAFKLYAANNVVCHYRHPKGYLLNYDAMRLVPQFFDGVDTGYESAIAKAITDRYGDEMEASKRSARRREIAGKVADVKARRRKAKVA